MQRNLFVLKIYNLLKKTNDKPLRCSNIVLLFLLQRIIMLVIGVFVVFEYTK